MSRYIDADLLLAQCRRNPLFEKTEEDKRMLYIERSIIDATPTADVVEVVRCKDCKRFLKMETSPSYDGKCLGYGYLVEAKHYCSYGESHKSVENHG